MVLSALVTFIITIIMWIGWHVGMWGIFKKAGKSAWLSLIPVYNSWVWLRILSRPWWWMIFIVFPFISIFMFYMMVWKTIRLYGKTSYIPLIGGTIFFCFYLPYLGFSKKEHYTTLDKLPKFKKSKLRDWCDCLIFAVAAAYIIRMFLLELYAIPTSSMESTLMVGDYLAVGKMDYGARVPMTPIAFPFVHHTLPLTKYTKSYVEWLQLPYFKFPAINKLERNHIVVFNYPDGDTVALERQSESYYAIVREFETMLNPNAPRAEMEDIYHKYAQATNAWQTATYYQAKYGKTPYYVGKGRDVVHAEYRVVARPIDKRENYVKRCVALAGDKLQIVDGQLFVNDVAADNPKRRQFSYLVTDPAGVGLSVKKRKSLNINEEDMQKLNNFTTLFCFTDEQKATVEKMGLQVDSLVDGKGKYDSNIFPHDSRYAWNKDNFGPIVIPQKGATVEINDSTIVLYDKIIRNYENNTLEIRDNVVYINGLAATTYTFKMDYFFMMGDNRHNSADSRFWGFVPEDHLVGKVKFVWLSLDKFKNFGEGKIRWNRMFRPVK